MGVHSFVTEPQRDGDIHGPILRSVPGRQPADQGNGAKPFGTRKRKTRIGNTEFMNQERTMRSKLILTCLGLGGLLASTARADLIPVTEDIVAGPEVTWTADNSYRLDTVVYVQDGGVLNIEPGTVIYGATNVTIGREDIPNLVSALWVTRGGRLNAVGTPEEPIIFTAEGDDLQGSLGPDQTSLWGGVVLLGRARINTAKDADGNAATPKYDLYEGTDGPGPNGEHTFGGDDDADSSGALKYVSIRHAGNEFAPASELNALTLGAVGSGTELSHVEAFAGSDDGFEWWGGTVAGDHLVSAFIEDDDFDTDQGYTGVNQFLLGVKPPWAGTADSRGFETDGDLNQSAQGEEPVSRWYGYNATMIGRGSEELSGSLGVAWNVRDETAPNVMNSIFAAWDTGVKLDSDGLYHFQSEPASARIAHNVWDVTTGATSVDGEFLFTTGEFLNTLEGAMLGGISYAADQGLDPRPQAGSPAFADVAAGAPVEVNYRGAFAGPSDGWADGWTALSQLGYLKPAEPALTVPVILDFSVADQTARVTVQSVEGMSYQLESKSPVTGPWGEVGDAVAGDGNPILIEAAAGAGDEYFRVRGFPTAP